MLAVASCGQEIWLVSIRVKSVLDARQDKRASSLLVAGSSWDSIPCFTPSLTLFTQRLYLQTVSHCSLLLTPLLFDFAVTPHLATYRLGTAPARAASVLCCARRFRE